MSRFQNDELGLEIPDGWRDLSTTSFVFPEAAASLSLSHGQVAAGATLEDCERDVRAQLVTIFPDLQVLERRVVEATVHLTVEWTSGLGALRQRLALLIADGELWSLVASSPRDEVLETGETIARAMRSFALRSKCNAHG